MNSTFVERMLNPEHCGPPSNFKLDSVTYPDVSYNKGEVVTNFAITRSGLETPERFADFLNPPKMIVYLGRIFTCDT